MRTAPVFKSMDSSEIEARFSNDSAIPYQDFPESDVRFEDIQPFLDRIPAREVDLLELYLREGKNQKDIAKIFSVTQGAISSRLARARTRLIFLRKLPKISEQEIETRLGAYCGQLEIEIIKSMIRTTCQSKTAEILNDKYNLRDEKSRMTQVKVRHRYEKCLAFLIKEKEKTPDLARYCHLLEYIKHNLYKLHEVKLPHFQRERYIVFSLNP